MSHDLEVLQEAVELSVASRQMDLANMGYNECVEIEANKQRELYELKPASWFEKTFNTDGELKRREEKVKIEMSLQSAKDSKDVFMNRQILLEPAHTMYQKGPYKKIISELKKIYGTPLVSGAQVVSKANSGELYEQNALIRAMSNKRDFESYSSKSVQSANKAVELKEITGKLHSIDKPSLFHQIFNTSSFKAYKSNIEELTEVKSKLTKEYITIKNEQNSLKESAFEYFTTYKTIDQLKDKHREIYDAENDKPIIDISSMSLIGALLDATSSPKPSKQKTLSQRWSQFKPKVNAQIDGHPFAIKSNPPSFEKKYE